MPEFIVQPKPQVTRTTHWGELKRCRSFNMTDTAMEMVQFLADREGVNRSEYLERAIRQLAAQAIDELNRPQ